MDEQEELTMAQTFGAWVKAVRGERTKRAVAKAAGFSEGYLRQIEKGYDQRGPYRIPVRPSNEVIVKLARALGVDPTKAMEAAGRDIAIVADHPPPPDDMGHLIEELRRVVEDMSRLWGGPA